MGEWKKYGDNSEKLESEHVALVAYASGRIEIWISDVLIQLTSLANGLPAVKASAEHVLRELGEAINAHLALQNGGAK